MLCARRPSGWWPKIPTWVYAIRISSETVAGGEGAAVDAKDIYGQTPVLLATRGGHPQAATVQLDAGAAVNATDIDRYPPLHRAATAGIPELVTLLRAYGADLTARAKGGATPRTLAHPAVAELLREKDQ